MKGVVKMLYVAYVKYREDKQSSWRFIEQDYPTKKAFTEDLRLNGYMVRYVVTKELYENQVEFERFVDNFYSKRESANKKQTYIRREMRKLKAWERTML